MVTSTATSALVMGVSKSVPVAGQVIGGVLIGATVVKIIADEDLSKLETFADIARLSF